MGKNVSLGKEGGYLGYIISKEGVAVDPEKVRCVMDWPQPRTVKAVRGFLGLTRYYRKFIKDYGKIARPLTDLVRKDQFKWSEEAQLAFDELKQKLITAPVLSTPDFCSEFEIECDASRRGIGAVLMQNRRPLAFFSKALKDRALAKSTYEKELMALVLAIQHWRPYLLGRRFKVYTDQKTLKHLLSQKVYTPDQQDWIAKLMGYDFKVVYKPGKENGAADSLSRLQEGGVLAAGSIPFWVEREQLEATVRSDSKLAQIIKAIKKDSLVVLGFQLEGSQLFYKYRLVIPSNSKWIATFIQEFHITPTGGHSGAFRTYGQIAENLYWIGMKNEIYWFVAECLICQTQKNQTLSPAGLLQPFPIPERI